MCIFAFIDVRLSQPLFNPFTFSSSHYDLLEVAGAVSVAHEGYPFPFKCNDVEESGSATRRETDNRYLGRRLLPVIEIFALIVGVLTWIRLSAAPFAPCHRRRLYGASKHLRGVARVATRRISPLFGLLLLVAAVVASAEALQDNGDSIKEVRAANLYVVIYFFGKAR